MKRNDLTIVRLNVCPTSRGFHLDSRTCGVGGSTPHFCNLELATASSWAKYGDLGVTFQ